MKITGYRVSLVEVPEDMRTAGPHWIILKLTTDEGLDGYGECTWHGFQNATNARVLSDICRDKVVGMDPFRIEELWKNLYLDPHNKRHTGPYVTPSISAIEIACWDIIGKACGQPIYNLLGGRVHDRLRSYSYLRNGGEDPKQIADKALEYLAKGFTALKLDPVAGETLEDMAYTDAVFSALRNAVGNRCDLLLGTHGQLTPHGAIQLAKRLEQYRPAWFEEPIQPENIEAMAAVARSTSIPIATGERLLTRFEFVELLEKRAASILQMDISMGGGILEWKKLASMADCYYMQTAPHQYGGPLSFAASVQVDTATPNFFIQETIEDFAGFDSMLVSHSIRWEDGYIVPPTEPGLGVEVDETLLKNSSVEVMAG